MGTGVLAFIIPCWFYVGVLFCNGALLGQFIYPFDGSYKAYAIRMLIALIPVFYVGNLAIGILFRINPPAATTGLLIGGVIAPIAVALFMENRTPTIEVIAIATAICGLSLWLGMSMAK